MIIYTCPRCGHDLQTYVITTIPPITERSCLGCGWSVEEHQEKDIRVPYPQDVELLIDGKSLAQYLKEFNNAVNSAFEFGGKNDSHSNT